jgi:hypothetical protein
MAAASPVELKVIKASVSSDVLGAPTAISFSGSCKKYHLPAGAKVALGKPVI